jgi:hypothetical protein
VDLEVVEEPAQRVLVVGGDLDPRPGGVDVGPADLDLEHAVVGPRVEDDVEDLGQDQ